MSIRFSSAVRNLFNVTALAGICVASNIALADAADNRLEVIRQSGELKICIWPEYFAISYRNQKNNQLQGLDIDLATAFASDLGVKPRFITTHFGRFMDDIEANACDIGMFGIGRTPARKARIDFSQPYLASGMYGLTTKTSTSISSWETMDQPGNVVCVQRGTYMEAEMRKQLKQAQLSVVEKPYEREIEVRSGRADVFITDYPYGQKMLKQTDWARLLTPEDQSGQKFEYAYAVAKNQPQWLQRVDGFVAAIKADGRLHDAAARHGLIPIVLD